MLNLLSLLCLASIIFFIIGIFNPNASLFWYKKQRTGRKSSLIYGSLTVLFFVLFGAVDKTNNSREINSTTEIPQNNSSNNSGNTAPLVSPSAAPDNTTQTPTQDNSENYSVEDQKIINKIKAKVKRDWPNDYTVQKMTFEQEVESYLYMKTVTDLSIKRKVQRDWPMDFTVQKMTYDQES